MNVQQQLVVARLDAHANRRVGRRELQRVVEEVHERTLDLRRVGVHRRGIAVELGDDALTAWTELLERPGDEIVGRPQLLMRCRGAALQAREVEQVADDPVEPLGFATDRLDEIIAVGPRQPNVGIAEA